MSWQQLIVRTEEKYSELISNVLTELGSDAVTIQDAKDQPIYEPLPDTMPLWDALQVTGLFSASKDLSPIISTLNSILNENINLNQSPIELNYKIEILEDKDWIRAWMDDFEPMQFGKKLWICPSWHQPPDKNAINILLDPGIAFGTGTHPTTALCLRWLDSFSEKADLEKYEFIDYGCGSGILSVASLMLGAKVVYAIDIDQQAIQATKDNAEKNHQQQKLQTFLPKQFDDYFIDKQVDVLLANILSAPLLELAEFFASKIKPGGQIVLSGILLEQADKICAHYKQWFDLEPIQQEQDWIRVCGKKFKADTDVL
jgi:ribosomal protein L11 methyltransferase